MACSDDLAAAGHRPRRDPARSETVPYGVDTGQFAPIPRRPRRGACAPRGSSDDDEIVFAIGRFVRKKGFEYLIDAAGRLAAARPRLRLVLAGWGDLEPEYRERLARAGLEGVRTCPGWCRTVCGRAMARGRGHRGGAFGAR